MAFRVSRRVNEIGVRVALGASRTRIAKLVLQEAVAMLLAGCLIGGAGALSLGRLIRALLFEVSPADPMVLSAAAGVLIAVGLAAGCLPARRAAGVDPMVALRCE
jgi:ABC-type antimicrobial peptide transport system permease subunit